MSLSGNVRFLQDIPIEVIVELGRTNLTVRELAELAPDDVIELDRAASKPLDVLAGGRVVARGEVVMVGKRLALRIVEVTGKDEDPTANRAESV